MFADDNASAKALGDDTLRRLPLLGPLRGLMAEIRRTEGDAPGAIRELQKVLEQAPTNITAIGFLSHAYIDNGEADKATRLAREPPRRRSPTTTPGVTLGRRTLAAQGLRDAGHWRPWTRRRSKWPRHSSCARSDGGDLCETRRHRDGRLNGWNEPSATVTSARAGSGEAPPWPRCATRRPSLESSIRSRLGVARASATRAALPSAGNTPTGSVGLLLAAPVQRPSALYKELIRDTSSRD